MANAVESIIKNIPHIYRDVPRFRRVVVTSLKFNIYAQTVSRIPCRHLIMCKD